MDIQEILTSATQVLDWLVANLDKVGLIVAIAFAVWQRIEAARKGEAVQALVETIEDPDGSAARRAEIEHRGSAIRPADAVTVAKEALKREVEARGNAVIDKAVDRLFGDKT